MATIARKEYYYVMEDSQLPIMALDVKPRGGAKAFFDNVEIAMSRIGDRNPIEEHPAIRQTVTEVLTGYENKRGILQRILDCVCKFLRISTKTEQLQIQSQRILARLEPLGFLQSKVAEIVAFLDRGPQGFLREPPPPIASLAEGVRYLEGLSEYLQVLEDSSGTADRILWSIDGAFLYLVRQFCDKEPLRALEIAAKMTGRKLPKRQVNLMIERVLAPIAHPPDATIDHMILIGRTQGGKDSFGLLNRVVDWCLDNNKLAHAEKVLSEVDLGARFMCKFADICIKTGEIDKALEAIRTARNMLTQESFAERALDWIESFLELGDGAATMRLIESMRPEGKEKVAHFLRTSCTVDAQSLRCLASIDKSRDVFIQKLFAGRLQDSDYETALLVLELFDMGLEDIKALYAKAVEGGDYTVASKAAYFIRNDRTRQSLLNKLSEKMRGNL